MSKHHWLEVAEYTALVSSAAGLVATVISQQVVYAAAPLTLSLSLGALNRQRLEQRTQQTNQATLAQLHSVNQALSSAPEPLTPEAVQAQINAVKQAVSRLHRNTEATVSEVRQFLANEMESLREQLQTELNQLPQPFDPSGLKQRVEQLAVMIAPLPQTTEAVTAQRQQISDLSQGIAVLEQRFEEIPSPPDLSSIEEAIAQLSQGLAAVEVCLAPLQAVDIAQLQEAIAQLQTEIPQQSDVLTSLPAQVQQLSQQVKQLEDVNQTLVKPYLSQLAAKLKPTTAAIAQLNQRLEVVGQQAMTDLERQKLEQLGQVASDLQHRFEQLSLDPFDPSPLQADIQAVRAQAANLQEQLEAVHLLIPELDRSVLEQQVEAMAVAIAHLEQRSQVFLTRQDLNPWQQEAIAPLSQEIFNLQSQLAILTQAFTERPEQEAIPQIETRVSELDTWIQDLDASLGDVHDRTRNLDVNQQLVEKLAAEIEVNNLDAKLAQLSEEILGQVDQAVEGRIAEVNTLLRQTQSDYQYKLVLNRHPSRTRLVEAIDQVQQRLILVCPWVCTSGVDSWLLQRLKVALDRGGQIDIGWGKYGESPETTKKPWKYDAMPSLEQLRAQYPNQLRLSFLGTHEKFLVCDRSFAMLGSHNFLTSSTRSKEREVGLYTTDPRLIDALIKRFEDGLQVQNRVAS